MKPIVVYVDWLDWFSGKDYFVSGVTLFPFVCIHKNLRDTIDGKKKITHETIHFYQALETLVVGFYFLYIYQFLLNLFFYASGWYDAYVMVSFEMEAFDNEEDFDYPSKRKWFAWRKY